MVWWLLSEFSSLVLTGQQSQSIIFAPQQDGSILHRLYCPLKPKPGMPVSVRWLWYKGESASRSYICSFHLDSELPTVHTEHELPCLCKQPRATASPVWWSCGSSVVLTSSKTTTNLFSFRKQLPVTCSCCSQAADLEQQPDHLQEIKLFLFMWHTA